jgi:hypothetical protein
MIVVGQMFQEQSDNQQKAFHRFHGSNFKLNPAIIITEPFQESHRGN